MSVPVAPAAPVEEAPGAVPVDRIRALTVRYVLASTAILAVGGLLGLVIRQSQAGIRVVSPALWYQLMTAHGLAAFVGWAAFALMGITWWVLAEVGFPLRGWGHRWAEACWWTMVIGVAGIVVTTLALGFGGSWVFLYPLPLESAGAWSETAAALFSLSVLSVGLSIFAYCFGVLHCVVGPGLTAQRPGLLNRLGAAMGLGLLWPRRYPTERPLPYPVIPLTVIAIDMVIATAPLAVLLVEMVAESIDPSVTVDPLLAKSMLWWFGHPVVYLLLFPAVAVYYHLIPRFAGRELVAGHIIAVVWLIAVTSNVVIGAHHMYTDFPNTLQQVVNFGMQPLTYAVTIPSAVSLFSLSFTIYRSAFRWTPASRFLAVALVSWLVAGLQGVGLATIEYDVVAHNTLWVVGHFHNMALLNIGLVIFAAVYAYLPTLVGRQWWSGRLADWHLALTVVGGYGSVVAWMLQGVEGAPRRFAVLPDRWQDESLLSIPFIALIAIGQLLFALNLMRTLGTPWLRAATPALPAGAGDAVLTREQPREALGAVCAAVAMAISLPALWSDPLLWAPGALVLAFLGATLGARRQGAVAMAVVASVLLVGLTLQL